MTESKDGQEAIAELRRRAIETVAHLRWATVERGLDTLSEVEIEAEIAEARQERRKRRTRTMHEGPNG